ncbi:MAG: phosphoribosylglycinamide formyltransferase [Egibacteraceae bacterium]
MDKRVVVLASGSGSNLQALLDHPDTSGVVCGVLTDRPGAGALERAAGAGIDAGVVAFGDFDERAAWAEALAEATAALRPDLVVLAGFMRILPGAFVERWPTLNVHPSLLPAFPGAHAVEAALDWGVKVTGCTVHLVDEEVDHGPIVAQACVAVEEGDDVAALHARIQAVEHRLLPEAVALFCADRLSADGRHVRIQP